MELVAYVHPKPVFRQIVDQGVWGSIRNFVGLAIASRFQQEAFHEAHEKRQDAQTRENQRQDDVENVEVLKSQIEKSRPALLPDVVIPNCVIISQQCHSSVFVYLLGRMIFLAGTYERLTHVARD